MLEGIGNAIWNNTIGALLSLPAVTWAWMLTWPWWGWAALAFIPLMLDLAFLVRVKQLFGWKAVATVILVQWSTFVYVFAYVRGKQDMAFNPFDNERDEVVEQEVVQPRRQTKRSVRVLPSLKDLFGKPSVRRRYNPDTNTWESLTDG